MKHKVECDLKGCKKTFVQTKQEQRFCSTKHHDRWWYLEKKRILKIAKQMGIGR